MGGKARQLDRCMPCDGHRQQQPENGCSPRSCLASPTAWLLPYIKGNAMPSNTPPAHLHPARCCCPGGCSRQEIGDSLGAKVHSRQEGQCVQSTQVVAAACSTSKATATAPANSKTGRSAHQ